MSIEQKFAPTITNEQTATLPAIRFEGEVQIVDTEQGLIEACNYLSQHSVIGFDTETRPSFKAGITNRVALIQLSTPERCYLFRLCRMKFGRELQRLLENPDIKKVGADVAGDIRSLNQLRHIRAAGFIDLQTIAPQWGIEEKSLRKLSAIVLGKRVSKAQRLSNWEAAQFTEQQISYAATDAWVCLEILAKLEATPKCNPAPTQEIKAQAEPQKIEQKAEQKAKSRRRPFRRRKPHNSKPTTETKE
ncbi:MAG: 3'-5' exonuclease domain-containing protein 2 [Rikenellaceae bacterium]|nr:3'-5' exonuclease domain-containing protein 2 [Rikenellaceae bacterium]